MPVAARGQGGSVAGSDQRSPIDGLDSRLAATTRTGWIGLAAVVAVVVAVVGWSVFGQAPTVARGQGLVIPPDGLYELGIASEGVVTELFIDVGDEVADGQTVARIVTADGDIEDVTSTVDGTVLQVLVKVGGFDVAGGSIATVEPFSDVLEVVVFVPEPEGNQVDVGMRAFVAPSSAPAAEYGSITGTVASVSPAPVDRARVELLVGRNAALVDLLAGSEPVIEVRVVMDLDDTNPSGLAWSAGSGPPFAITAGSLASVTVILDDQRPIDRLLP